MKTSKKISVVAATVSIAGVILGILFVNPLEQVAVRGVPVMIYVLILFSVAAIFAGYMLVPLIEKLEEKGD